MTGERERERRDSAHDVHIMYIYKGMSHFPANFKGIHTKTCYLKIHTKYIDSKELVEFVFVGQEGSSDILFHHPFTRHTYLSPFSRAIFSKTR